MTTTNNQQTIKAEVGANFFEIVDRLFDNTARTVCVELIQNARRAGATKIEFETSTVPDFDGIAVVVRDNGCGVQDMSELLRIRSSGWDEGVKRREDPAGMGFFCLSRMKNLSVRSGNNEVFMGENCEAMKGRTEVPVENTDEYVEGTELRFMWPDMKSSDLRTALYEVGEHAPVSVTLDEHRVRQTPFRPVGIIDEFDTDDCRVYIYNRSYNSLLQINFHGLVVEEEMLHRIADYAVKIDIKETSNLQMVLPARNAMVHNEAFKQLMDTVRRRIYTLLQASGSHRIPFVQWLDAQSLGVTLNPAEQSLAPYGSDEPMKLPSDVNCCIMSHSTHRGTFESVAVAMAADGRYKLFKADQKMEGYAWYDALPSVTHVEFVVDGEERNKPGGVDVKNGMRVNIHLDWSDDPIEMGLPAPVFVGKLSYADDDYKKAVERAGGFFIDTNFKLCEESMRFIIDAAWKPVYISDAKSVEWNRLRDMDIRKCMSGTDDALEYALKSAIQDAISKMPHAATYAGSEIKLSCYIEDDGSVTIDRF